MNPPTINDITVVKIAALLQNPRPRSPPKLPAAHETPPKGDEFLTPTPLSGPAVPAEVDIQVRLDVRIMRDGASPRRLLDPPKMSDGLRRAWRLIPGLRWISKAFDNESVRPLNKAGNIASEALIEIADIWKVDHARSVETEHGFDWWPGDFRVSVSAIRRTDGHVPETWMLSVKTDFLKDVPLDSDRFVNFASLSSGVYGATHAWVFPPAEVWNHYRTPGATPQLWFANTAYLTAENAWWLPRFLADMSINQPINAPLAAKMREMLGGVLNVSRPRLLGRSAQQDVLSDALAVNSPWKTEPSRWIASGEFETIAEKLESAGPMRLLRQRRWIHARTSAR